MLLPSRICSFISLFFFGYSLPIDILGFLDKSIIIITSSLHFLIIDVCICSVFVWKVLLYPSWIHLTASTIFWLSLFAFSPRLMVWFILSVLRFAVGLHWDIFICLIFLLSGIPWILLIHIAILYQSGWMMVHQIHLSNYFLSTLLYLQRLCIVVVLTCKTWCYDRSW